MNNVSDNSFEYTAGGALPMNAETYVERQADEDLFKSLLAGRYCYVLNTRQMGKTSLRVRTMARLTRHGCVCAEVDLSRIASDEATETQWYDTVIRRLVDSFRLKDRFDSRTWLGERKTLPPSERFGDFLESVVLKCFPEKQIVIFFDEIDSTLRLRFPSDQFFSIIRAYFNSRADKPDLNRLTFVLLGVADPSELIQDKSTTPFNIGHAVELSGFTLREAQPLLTGFAQIAERPEELLKVILHWSGGQPFLTQKVCLLVNNARSFIPAGEESSAVDRIVREGIINNWEAQDDPRHLKTISERIIQSPKRRTSRLLGLYQQILNDGKLRADSSPEQMELRLSGLVVNTNGWLTVYNPVYRAVFNEEWVETNLARLRPYSESLLSWYKSDCKDESRLLRGKALQDAEEWAKGKDLSTEDWRFLAASQELERQATEEALVSAQEATRILEAANVEAQRKASHARTIFLVALMSAIVLAGGAAAFAYKRISNAEQRASSVEEQAKQADAKLKQTGLELSKANLEYQSVETKLRSINEKNENQSKLVEDLRLQLKNEQANVRKAKAEARSSNVNAETQKAAASAAIADLQQKLQNIPKCQPN
jgi:hypothetical protein